MHTAILEYRAPADRRALTLAHRISCLPATWMERSRQRQQLRRMHDWQLRDIGISRVDALYEADKPFWRA